MFGLSQAMTWQPGATVDAFRYHGEIVPPALYLTLDYYHRWYFISALSLLEAGMVTVQELRDGRAAPGTMPRQDAMQAADVAAIIAEDGKTDRATGAPPRFMPGQRVLTRNLHPDHHTRLPRYARGKHGLIHRLHGPHVFPDTNAHDLGEAPQHLYCVAFTAHDLWGPEASPHDRIYLDLWESYLDPA
jgi:nitrile hydratase